MIPIGAGCVLFADVLLAAWVVMLFLRNNKQQDEVLLLKGRVQALDIRLSSVERLETARIVNRVTGMP